MIEVVVSQNDRSATIALVNSGPPLVDPSFSLQTSASLIGASYASTELGGSGAISSQVSSINGNLSVDSTGSLLGTVASGATILTIELEVQSAGTVTVNGVSGTLAGDSLATVSSPTFDLIEPTPDTADFIRGEFAEGETIFVDTGFLPDWSEFLSSGTETYQWYREGIEIVGATSNNYELTADDVGFQLTAVVEYRDSNFESRSVESFETAAVEAEVNSPASGAPTVIAFRTSDIALPEFPDESGFVYQESGWGIYALVSQTDQTVSLALIKDLGASGTFSADLWFRAFTFLEGSLSAGAFPQDDLQAANWTLQYSSAAGSETVNSLSSTYRFESGSPRSVASVNAVFDAYHQERFTQGLPRDLSVFSAPDMFEGTLVSFLEEDTFFARVVPENQFFPTIEGSIDLGGFAEALAVFDFLSVQRPNYVFENFGNSLTDVGLSGHLEVYVPTSEALKVGDRLEVNTSEISDSDGLGEFSYSWLRDGVPISGAVFREYVITDEDEGATLSVEVSFTDGSGFSETLVSAAAQTVNNKPSGELLIDGALAQGETLNVNAANISDLDGLGELNFKWLRDGAPIPNAGSTTYVLSQDDVGTQISVEVSYIDLKWSHIFGQFCSVSKVYLV